MADGKKISAMIRATEANGENLFETSQASAGADGGYITRAISMNRMAETMLNSMEYTSELETDAKKIIPAINELKNRGGGGSANAVLYTPQSLTDAQKEQARQNIGAGTGEGGGVKPIKVSYEDLTFQMVDDSFKKYGQVIVDDGGAIYELTGFLDLEELGIEYYLIFNNFKGNTIITISESEKSIESYLFVDSSAVDDKVTPVARDVRMLKEETAKIEADTNLAVNGGTSTNYIDNYILYDDGETLPANNYIVTNKIPVTAGSRITWNCGKVQNGTRYGGLVEYNSAGGMIIGYSATNNRTITLKSNTAYIVATFSKLNTPNTIVDSDGNVLFEMNIVEVSGVKKLTEDLTAEQAETEQLKADLTEQSESLEALWKLNKGQTYDIQQKVESGMNVSPKGAKYETLLDVRGESRQNKTNGYQLLDFLSYGKDVHTEQGITFTKQEDGSYIANGIATANANGWIVGNYTNTTPIFTLPAGSYKGSNYSGLYFYDGTTRKNFGTTFTLAESTPITAVLVKTYVSGDVVNNEHWYPFLESGTVLHDWEPYTGGIPSPNPDYPQEIHSVEEINISVNGEVKTIIPPFALNGIDDIHDYADVDKGVWFSTYRLLTNVEVVKQSINKITGTDGNEYWSVGYSLRDVPYYYGITTNAYEYTMADKLTSVIQNKETTYGMSIISAYGHNTQYEIRFRLLVRDYATVDDVFDFIKTLKIITLKEPTETPIDSADLEFLKSLFNMETENTNLIITDQDGNDISYLMEYIIKLSEVN